MAREGRRRGRALAAILGLCLLAGVAFLVGALAGLIWKEPGLLVAYLRGETSEVTWSTAASETSPPATEPLAAQAPPAPSEDRKPLPLAGPPAGRERSLPPPRVAAAPEPAAREAAPAAPAPKPSRDVAAPPPASRVAIQVGAFAERTAADRLRASLESDGYPAYVAAGVGGGSPHWRVRVGPYASRDQADEVSQRLKRTHELPTWVVDEDAE